MLLINSIAKQTDYHIPDCIILSFAIGDSVV